MNESKKKRYPSPSFRSAKEEQEYWKTHSPLAEGYEGEIQRTRQKRSSFLAVRMTSEELTRLRDIAAKKGLGPSTYARLLLSSAIKQGGTLPEQITIDELRSTIQETLPQPVVEKAIELMKSIAIGDPNNPSLLVVDAGQLQQFEELALTFFSVLLAIAGIRVIPPEDNSYEELKRASQVVEKVK